MQSNRRPIVGTCLKQKPDPICDVPQTNNHPWMTIRFTPVVMFCTHAVRTKPRTATKRFFAVPAPPHPRRRFERHIPPTGLSTMRLVEWRPRERMFMGFRCEIYSVRSTWRGCKKTNETYVKRLIWGVLECYTLLCRPSSVLVGVASFMISRKLYMCELDVNIGRIPFRVQQIIWCLQIPY